MREYIENWRQWELFLSRPRNKDALTLPDTIKMKTDDHTQYH